MLVYAIPSYGRGSAIQRHLDAIPTYTKNGVQFDAVLAVTSGPGYTFGHGIFTDYAVPFIHYHSEERLYLGEARNVITSLFSLLAEKSGNATNAVVQTDDDCLLAPTDMRILVNTFLAEEQRTGLAMPLLKTGFVCQAARKVFEEEGVSRTSIHAPFRLVISGLSAIRAVGHYDPFLKFTQDLDYAIRVRAAGFDPACYDTPLGEDTLPEAKFGGQGLYRQTSVDDEVQRARQEQMLRYKTYLMEKYPGSFIDKRGNFLWQAALKKASPEVRKGWARYVGPFKPMEELKQFLDAYPYNLSS